MSIQAAQNLLDNLLQQLSHSTQYPIPQDALHAVVSQTVANAPSKGSLGAWDACLRKNILATVSIVVMSMIGWDANTRNASGMR